MSGCSDHAKEACTNFDITHKAFEEAENRARTEYRRICQVAFFECAKTGNTKKCNEACLQAWQKYVKAMAEELQKYEEECAKNKQGMKACGRKTRTLE